MILNLFFFPIVVLFCFRSLEAIVKNENKKNIGKPTWPNKKIMPKCNVYKILFEEY
jgi:hypothetical protein